MVHEFYEVLFDNPHCVFMIETLSLGLVLFRTFFQFLFFLYRMGSVELEEHKGNRFHRNEKVVDG